MEDDANFVKVVVGFCSTTGDPGGLPEADFAFDDEGIGGVPAGRVSIVELIGFEEAVGVEYIGTGEEFWAWPNLTPGDGE